jgi:hypothetical protein
MAITQEEAFLTKPGKRGSNNQIHANIRRKATTDALRKYVKATSKVENLKTKISKQNAPKFQNLLKAIANKQEIRNAPSLSNYDKESGYIEVSDNPE